MNAAGKLLPNNAKLLKSAKRPTNAGRLNSARAMNNAAKPPPSKGRPLTVSNKRLNSNVGLLKNSVRLPTVSEKLLINNVGLLNSNDWPQKNSVKLPNFRAAVAVSQLKIRLLTQ